jgi:hypothetical protein
MESTMYLVSPSAATMACDYLAAFAVVSGTRLTQDQKNVGERLQAMLVLNGYVDPGHQVFADCMSDERIVAVYPDDGREDRVILICAETGTVVEQPL